MLLHTNKPNHDASKLTKLFYIIDATSFDWCTPHLQHLGLFSPKEAFASNFL
jgi:hypothetical protein